MKTKFIIVTFVIAVMALFASCGGKSDIWKDIKDSDEVPEKVWENIRKAKYDLNTFSPDGYTFLTKFLPSMDINNFNACVEAGADVNLVDANGIYPLFVCLNNEYDVIHKILSLTKDINVKDSKGRNVLTYLVKTNDDILYKFFLLVEKGVDTSVYDSEENEWPFIYIFNEYRSDTKLINYILSDQFKMCTHPDAVEVDNDITRRSFKMIQEAKKNPLKEFTPPNKKQTPPDDFSGRYLKMPGLILQSEWSIERGKDIKHYLMCDIKVGSNTFKAGTEVKITGPAETENPDDYVYVDGAYCREYKVMIDYREYTIPARYISMFSSEHTFFDTKETVLLLSTFAFTDPDSNWYPEDFLDTQDYESFEVVDLVLVKNNVAYKIETSEVKDGFCFKNLEIMEWSQIHESPVIHGSRFSSPVDSIEGFYYLCGNKLKKIVVTNVYYDSEYERIFNEYIGFELKSTNMEQLLFKMRCYSESEYDGDAYTYTAYKPYSLVAPYIWDEDPVFEGGSDYDSDGK
ncbi:hypothetical protein [Treponema sp.]|uniref:hypothetical protein n=1 Tax=Treponema sp. TaxID=166 RepID=UPI00298E95BF|nr:hypothetical protein [Treponema sp.]MCR5613829.1 hypothetical protein [Treponema sp.]